MAETSDKLRVFIIAGSSRRITNCPAADSKASFFVQRAKELLPKDWIVDVFNVANDFVLPKIQSCNACVSTSMALCVWPCNCYKKHSFLEPDLMWDEDIYARIYAADAILVCAPVNWYGPTSSMKMLFDRLICANGGNPDESIIRHKDGALAAKLENSPKWKDLSLNHLEGMTAAFFVYGDNGGDEIASDGRPMILKHKEYFDPGGEEHFNDPAHAYGPIIWQCRYSGIEVPEPLIKGIYFGLGGKYSNNQIPHVKKDTNTLAEFDQWLSNIKDFVQKKGKAPTGKYPVPFTGADSEMPVFWRQLQLLFRTVLGGLWMHSIGYFTSRSAARKLRLYKN
jgi:multimeric flavodoxin WrbA